MSPSPRTVLKRIETIRAHYGPEAAAEKLGLLRTLARARLATAGELRRLHEVLLFLRAFPDDEAVLEASESLLAGFVRRADLRGLRSELEDTGLEGTAVNYSFSLPMSRWLAGKDPQGARIDWEVFEKKDDLDGMLHLLTARAEAPGVDDETLSVEEWLEGARSGSAADYATLVSRFDRLDAGETVREQLYNQLDVPVRWTAGAGVGSATSARWPVDRQHFQAGPLERTRPDLRRALKDSPRIRRLDPRAGARLVDLARGGMSVRHRELEAFDYADPRDAWVAEAGRGLLITLVGMRPERRLLPEALYAGLYIKNGLPIGYWLASALFGSSEMAYNVFSTFRQGESSWMYGRTLATLHAFLGATDFTVMRYQFGHENEEAIESGAFWFYQKLGFRPRGPALLRLMRSEVKRLKSRKGYRTPPETLRRLAEENIFFGMGAERDDLIGLFPYESLGHQATRYLASLHADPAKAGRLAVEEAERRLGVRSRSSWPLQERRAFEAWAPLVAQLRGLERWPAAERRSLVRALRAKGGRSEAEFVRLSNGHARFRRALQRLCLAHDR
jgi:hypothetical protein